MLLHFYIITFIFIFIFILQSRPKIMWWNLYFLFDLYFKKNIIIIRRRIAELTHNRCCWNSKSKATTFIRHRNHLQAVYRFQGLLTAVNFPAILEVIADRLFCILSSRQLFFAPWSLKVLLLSPVFFTITDSFVYHLHPAPVCCACAGRRKGQIFTFWWRF